MGAQVRSFITQLLVQQVRRLGEAEAALVLAPVGAEALARITAAERTEWTAFEDHLAVLDALRAKRGDAALRALHRRVAGLGMQTPFLKAFAQTAFRLFGVNPGGLALWAPKAWPHITRNAGAMIAQRDGDQAVKLALEGLAGPYLLSGTFALALAGSYEAFLDLARASGDVELVTLRPTVECRLTWTARG